jgi:hypothetical protein
MRLGSTWKLTGDRLLTMAIREKKWDGTLPLSRRLEIGWNAVIKVISKQQWLVVLSASPV